MYEFNSKPIMEVHLNKRKDNVKYQQKQHGDK